VSGRVGYPFIPTPSSTEWKWLSFLISGERSRITHGIFGLVIKPSISPVRVKRHYPAMEMQDAFLNPGLVFVRYTVRLGPVKLY
jgi:hypothetical protein